MGAASSSANSRSSARLPRSARYAALDTPNGTVHVLGVYPCSTTSAHEAEELVRAVKPAVVYVGLHPEVLSVVAADVRANRLVDAGWRIPEQPPSFGRYEGASWLVSVNLRNQLADSEMLGLLGAEALLPYKTAVRAALGLGAGAAAGAAQPPALPKLVAFPLAMDYNNGETLDQPANLATMLVGNAAQGSTALKALVGNPNTWFFTAEPLPTTGLDAAAAEAAAAAAAAAPADRPEVELDAAIPEDSGYFTRAGVLTLQTRFRDAVNDACERSSAASADVEEDFLRRERAARSDERVLLDRRAKLVEALEAPGASPPAPEEAAARAAVAQELQAAATRRGETAVALAARSMLSQRVSQAVAFHIQAELAAAAAAATTPESAPGSASSTQRAGAARPSAVAIVNLGAMASLQRNWDFARAPEDVFVPLSPLQNAVGWAVPAGGGAAALYGVYRGARRFPRTTGVVVSAVALGAGAVAYSAVHGDWTRYGLFVRSALARPRITAAVTRAGRP